MHYVITAESAGERILKTGQYLAKLWARVECPVFCTPGVDQIYTVYNNLHLTVTVIILYTPEIEIWHYFPAVQWEKQLLAIPIL